MMQTQPKPLHLKKDAERRVFAGHLWIFSNDIDSEKSPLKNYAAGDLVSVITSFGKSIAIGYINPNCLLCIRILTLNISETIDTNFFIKKIETAKLKREKYFEEKYYRVVFGEGDRLPGVVMDQFNDVIVLQINTAGMENLKSFLIEAVQKIFQPKSIVLKCDSSERKMENLNEYTEVTGEALPENMIVRENNCEFEISLIDGQKTGWFYDHRFNRASIAKYCHDKKVLDVFSYCGGFTIPCAKHAKEVTAIDRSKDAIEKLQQNAARNSLNNIKTLCGDALDLMKSLDKKSFDVIILDPPALIKRKKDLIAGEKMYQQLNEAALNLLNDGGILLSASCSMHMSSENLLNQIRRAGINAKRELSVIEHCHQGSDHPIHPAMTETNYLKGFILST